MKRVLLFIIIIIVVISYVNRKPKVYVDKYGNKWRVEEKRWVEE